MYMFYSSLRVCACGWEGSFGASKRIMRFIIRVFYRNGTSTSYLNYEETHFSVKAVGHLQSFMTFSLCEFISVDSEPRVIEISEAIGLKCNKTSFKFKDKRPPASSQHRGNQHISANNPLHIDNIVFIVQHKNTMKSGLSTNHKI